jgi:hypothetical protein
MRPVMRFLLLLIRRRYWSRRAGIARRLSQDVVLSNDHFTVAALGVALLALEPISSQYGPATSSNAWRAAW